MGGPTEPLATTIIPEGESDGQVRQLPNRRGEERAVLDGLRQVRFSGMQPLLGEGHPLQAVSQGVYALALRRSWNVAC